MDNAQSEGVNPFLPLAEKTAFIDIVSMEWVTNMEEWVTAKLPTLFSFIKNIHQVGEYLILRSSFF